MSTADPEALSQGMTSPGHLRKRVQKGKRCSKGWKKVCSIGSKTRGRVYLCTQMTQGVGHTTVAAKTLKVATKVIVQEQQVPLPPERRCHKRASSRKTKELSESKSSVGRHWKSKLKSREMMRVTTIFLREEVAASNRERKKSFPSWKQQEANQK
ncbi:hypothetical protein Tco_1062066 [Tanacetum coccineum]